MPFPQLAGAPFYPISGFPEQFARGDPFGEGYVPAGVEGTDRHVGSWSGERPETGQCAHRPAELFATGCQRAFCHQTREIPVGRPPTGIPALLCPYRNE